MIGASHAGEHILFHHDPSFKSLALKFRLDRRKVYCAFTQLAEDAFFNRFEIIPAFCARSFSNARVAIFEMHVPNPARVLL